MKSRILTFVVLSVILASCGTKKTTTTVTETRESDLPATSTVDVAVGQNLYENNCAKCHKLFEPKSYSQEEWKPILISMQKKAHLDDAQMANISAYINAQL